MKKTLKLKISFPERRTTIAFSVPFWVKTQLEQSAKEYKTSLSVIAEALLLKGLEKSK